MIYLDLIFNLTLLIALSIFSGFIEDHWPRRTHFGVLLQGILFGGTAVLGMLQPLNLGSGLIFDGRSIMLSLCALFFGPWAALVAGVITIACRIWLGGMGLIVGCLVILSSVSIGLLARYRLNPDVRPPSVGCLYLFGIAVHIAMLAIMFLLPKGAGLNTVKLIGLPVILLYPLATILVGKIMSDEVETELADKALHRLNRELRAISNCNQTLLRAVDEQTLLNAICRIICDEAGYRLAWVGYAEHDAAKTIRPVAWAGFENGYIAHAELSWADDSDRGQSPAGKAIRTGEAVSLQDFKTVPHMNRWRASVLQHGYRSGIALPLKDENANVFGVLMINSAEIDAITSSEIRLLEELAGDLAFGIVALRTRVERRRAEESLLRAKEQAEAANKYKTDFLLNISHDLRTPLNAILGLAHVLKSAAMANEYRKAVDFIDERAKYLLALVEDILDLSRMESGRTELRSEEFDFMTLLTRSITIFRNTADKKNVTIALQIEEAIPRMKGDTMRLQQIIDNLLSNAVKYTEQGTITVTVGLDAEQPDKDKYQTRLSVKDTGFGIPADKLPHVFDAFTRFHEFYKGKTYEGVGLGLCIVHNLAHLMGGRVSVASEVGKGSEFIAILSFDKVT